MRRIFMKLTAAMLAATLTMGLASTDIFAATGKSSKTVNAELETITTETIDVETETAKVENSEKLSEKKSDKKTTVSEGRDVVTYACKFIGNPYRYGGTSLTKGTDCSGFVMSVYKNFGINLPHSSSSMRRVGDEVSLKDIQPGDIVCYSGHVAIYAGDGKIVHASTRRTGIKMGKVKYKHIVSIRRIL